MDPQRLHSWKEIAAHLKTSVRTVQRWQRDGLPVRRVWHEKRGTIYVDVKELEDWIASRSNIRQTIAPAEIRRPSLAVLPFEALRGGEEEQYFGDGLAEDLINALVGLGGLRVKARHTAFQLHREGRGPAEIARELAADTLLTGTIRRSGDRMRVVVHLVEGRSGECLWSESFDCDVKELFEVQDQVARFVARKLSRTLVKEDEVVRRGTESVDAYRLYLEGRYHLQRLTAAHFAKALECFEAAVELDPDYAAAIAGMADFYFAIAAVGGAEPGPLMEKAGTLARRALTIDEHCSEARSVYACVLANDRRDWKAAGREFAIVLADRSTYLAHYRHILWMLIPHLRLTEAESAVAQYLEDDPLALLYRWCSAFLRILARDFAGAEAAAAKLTDIDPTFAATPLLYCIAHAELNQERPAMAAAERGLELTGRSSGTLAYYAYVLGRFGKADRAARAIGEMRAGARYVSPGFLALAHAGLRDRERTLALLEEADRIRDPRLFDLRLPMFDFLKREPAYLALVDRLGLPRESAGS